MKPTDDIGDDEMPEFSDDEEEQAYLASLKNKPPGEKNKASGETANKRRKGNENYFLPKNKKQIFSL